MALRFTKMWHTFRRENKLSLQEYVFCDLIYWLSTNPKSRVPGWCHASKDYLARELGIAKSSVMEIQNRMLERGFIEKNDVTKFLRTTEKWYSVYFETDPTGIPETGTKEEPHTGNRNGTIPETGMKPIPETGTNTIYNNTNNDTYVSLSGNEPDPSEEKTDEVDAGKGKRKKVAPKKEKTPPDPAFNPCKDIWNNFMLEQGYLPVFEKNSKALKEFITYLRVFIREKEGHEPDDAYVVKVFANIFKKRHVWGKFESTLYEMFTINKFKTTIVGNVFRGYVPKSGEKPATKDSLKAYDDL